MLNIIQATTDEFHAVDSADPRFFIVGRVSRRGLAFRLRTRDLKTNDRSSISAQEFFDAMMLALEPGDPPFYAVIGDWTNEHPEYISNLFLFNRGIRNGKTPEEAAAKTPTGQMAARWGYVEVNIVRRDISANGDFNRVLVLFLNPNK